MVTHYSLGAAAWRQGFAAGQFARNLQAFHLCCKITRAKLLWFAHLSPNAALNKSSAVSCGATISYTLCLALETWECIPNVNAERVNALTPAWNRCLCSSPYTFSCFSAFAGAG